MQETCVQFKFRMAVADLRSGRWREKGEKKKRKESRGEPLTDISDYISGSEAEDDKVVEPCFANEGFENRSRHALASVVRLLEN